MSVPSINVLKIVPGSPELVKVYELALINSVGVK